MSEQLQFDKTIRKIERLFFYAGINIKSGENTLKNEKKLLIIYIINFIWLNTDVFGGILYFIDGIMKGKDFFALTYIAPCIGFSNLANFKSFFLIYHGKSVQQLMGNLRQLEKDENNRKEDVEKKKIIATDLKFLNIVINVLNFIYVVLILAFAISPLVQVAVKYHKTNQLELILPFLILYPFDPYNIKYYPYVLLHQFWSEIVAVLDICPVDHFYFICCIFIRIQFRLLKHDFERIIEDRRISAESLRRDAAFKAKFSELVKWHQKLIDSVNMLETIYSMSTLVNFMTSSIIICLTGFNVTMVDDRAFIVTFLSFLFMSLVQIFFLCFFADLLMASSSEISEAIYNCKWYLRDASIGKQLLIVQIRAQNPCKLTASGFADVNLNSFMRVLSTAWSYFALLQTMYGGSK